LDEKHISRIFKAYKKYKDEEGFARLVSTREVIEQNNGKLAINLYIRKEESGNTSQNDFSESYMNWTESSEKLKESMKNLFEVLAK